MKKNIILRPLLLLLFTFFSTVLTVGCGFEANEEPIKATYNMDMEDSRGERVSMEEFRDKVIFMNIWATWCAPCIEEMPTIQNLYQSVDKDKVAFIMLSMDQDFQKAIDFRKKYGYDFEIYRLRGPMPALYHTKLIPTTFVINSDGYLVMQHDGKGQFDTPEFKEFIKATVERA